MRNPVSDKFQLVHRRSVLQGCLIGTVLVALGALSGCCRHHPDTVPTPDVPYPRWVLVPANVRVEDIDGGTLTLPARAQFLTATRPPLKLPPGRTDADRKAVEEQRRQLYVIRGPQGHYWVSRRRAVATDSSPRDFVPGEDTAAAEFYAAIQNAIGARLAEAMCATDSESVDMIALTNWRETQSDLVALRMLDSARVDPAAYPRIEGIGKKTFVRSPNWGRPPGGRC